ncbi:hypothetical protein AYO44_07625 [Planctomycetaceae bacterium SCGC AG-212-F19]|nr:hypothetical protein AYO44_07625 [Planctomycetaceae bacterium SCGC AG-212-F19]
MPRFTTPKLILVTTVLLSFSGCSSSQRQWEITVENKSDVPCSFFITSTIAGGSSNAKVEDVAKGKPTTLIVGDTKTTVQSVRVVRGKDEHSKDEQTFNPNVELPVGKRFAIVVNADGQVETSTTDR